MKLWSEKKLLLPSIETLTTGYDVDDDLELLKWDCKASATYASMLARIGLLKEDEEEQILQELAKISAEADLGHFKISKSQEDCHTAIEERLTEKLGAPGQKIHLGRSRNDQVLTAIRLYSRERIGFCIENLELLINELADFISRNKGTRMPGMTHTRKAMPSSIAMWAGGYRDALLHDLELLMFIGKHTDLCPLGTGAGYGVPLPIDRDFVSKELEFRGIQENPVHTQLSRGKFEASILHGLSAVMYDLSRLASDMILFSMPMFGYLEFSDSVCTGSSMMPQKKNPDPLELIRGNYHVVCSLEASVKGISGGLVSGYHRDIQLTKRPLIKGFRVTGDCIKAAAAVISQTIVSKEKCENAMTEELFAFEKASTLAVSTGIPFREAYREIAVGYSKEIGALKSSGYQKNYSCID